MVSFPSETLNFASPMVWSNMIWTTPSSAKSPKFSFKVAPIPLTITPAFRSSLTSAPLVNTSWAPSSTVMVASLAMVMLALTVNVAPFATTT